MHSVYSTFNQFVNRKQRAIFLFTWATNGDKFIFSPFVPSMLNIKERNGKFVENLVYCVKFVFMRSNHDDFVWLVGY